MNENWPQHTEVYDVVLLKNGVNSLDAKPGDFKRITVVASSPLQAQFMPEVEAEKEYTALHTAPVGVATDPEIHARRRELEGASGSKGPDSYPTK